MNDKKRENLFAKLGQLQTAKTVHEETAGADVLTLETEPLRSSAAVDVIKARTASRKPLEPVRGKRQNPDYVQANCYVPKTLRRSVDRALLDIEGLDYSSLVEELLRKWLKSKGISE
jgi:hypothetical protein